MRAFALVALLLLVAGCLGKPAATSEPYTTRASSELAPTDAELPANFTVASRAPPTDWKFDGLQNATVLFANDSATRMGASTAVFDTATHAHGMLVQMVTDGFRGLGSVHASALSMADESYRYEVTGVTGSSADPTELLVVRSGNAVGMYVWFASGHGPLERLATTFVERARANATDGPAADLSVPVPSAPPTASTHPATWDIATDPTPGPTPTSTLPPPTTPS